MPTETTRTPIEDTYNHYSNGLTESLLSHYARTVLEENKPKSKKGILDSVETFNREYLEETQKLHFEAGFEAGRAEIISGIMSNSVLRQTIKNEQIELWGDEKKRGKEGYEDNGLDKFYELNEEIIIDRIKLKRRIIGRVLDTLNSMKDEKNGSP